MRAWAYRLLGQREYSVAELGQRLRLKWPGPGSDGVGELLDALVAENLLSDERFTASVVRSHIQRQHGPLKIRAALRAKGVADALIAAELDHHDHAWADLAAQWLERQHAGPLDYASRGKFYRRLQNRGFTHEQAMEAIDRI
ncbi:MAG: regulatory protein RecX [Lysobacterales bacterium]